MLKQEIELFQKNIHEWAKCQSGQFVLIKGTAVVGFFPSFEVALAEGTRRFGLEPYLLRAVQEKNNEVIIPALMLGVLNADLSHSI